MFERNRARSKAKVLGILLIIATALVFNWMPLVKTVLAKAPKETEPGYFEFDSDNGAIMGYDAAGGREVVIPAKIAGKDVTKIGLVAFYKKELTSVSIPEGIVEIGKDAFRENNLTSVEIPNSLEVIGEAAFYENNLTSVVIPTSVRSLEGWAFGANDLTSVEIGAAWI